MPTALRFTLVLVLSLTTSTSPAYPPYLVRLHERAVIPNTVNVSDLVVVDQIAYAVDAGRLSLFAVSDPTSPQHLATVPTTLPAYRVAISPRRAYVSSLHILQIDQTDQYTVENHIDIFD